MGSYTQHLSWMVPVIAASCVTLFSFVALCTYCFKKSKEQAEEEEVEEAYKQDQQLMKERRSSDPHFKLQLPSREEHVTSLPGTPSRVPLQEPGFGNRSVRYGAMTPIMSPALTEHPVQPPSREFKGILKSREVSTVGFGDQAEIPQEPEPPSPDAKNENLGTIYFTLSYFAENLVLKLIIQKATGLPAKDISGTSDPFVKVLLLPDKKHKLETRVKRKNLNPTWNEVFTFEGFPHQKLVQRTLYLQVLDYDRFSRNDPIGEIDLDLSNVHFQAEPVQFTKQLRHCKRNPDYLGDLLISMCYNPTQSRITIVVMKCTNVKVMDITGSCGAADEADPYVKVYLVHAGKRIDKKKTQIKRRTLNPVWNEVFTFDVPIDKIRDITFVFTVMDFDRILSNEAIGQVNIGYRTAGTSLKHWTEMLNSPRKPVAMWHKIIKY